MRGETKLKTLVGYVYSKIYVTITIQKDTTIVML